jgi:hypothetical protein
MGEEDDGDAQPPGVEAEAMGEDQVEPEPEENNEGDEVCHAASIPCPVLPGCTIRT